MADKIKATPARGMKCYGTQPLTRALLTARKDGQILNQTAKKMTATMERSGGIYVCMTSEEYDVFRVAIMQYETFALEHPQVRLNPKTIQILADMIDCQLQIKE